MVKMAVNSPTSSPVTITVTSSGGSRSLGLTSPMPRHSISNNPNSPLSGGGGGENNRRASSSGGHGRYTYLSFPKDSTDEFVAYTVQIPPTPENRPLSDSQTTSPLDSGRSGGKIIGSRNPNESSIRDTIYTGGFNSATKAHARKSSEAEPTTTEKSKMICGMEGCDEKAINGKFKNNCVGSEYVDCYGRN